MFEGVFVSCFIFKLSCAISELVHSAEEYSYVVELDFFLGWFLVLHFRSQLVMPLAGLECCSRVWSGQGWFPASSQPFSFPSAS